MRCLFFKANSFSSLKICPFFARESQQENVDVEENIGESEVVHKAHSVNAVGSVNPLVKLVSITPAIILVFQCQLPWY